MQEARAMAAEYFLWVGGWGRGGRGGGINYVIFLLLLALYAR